MTRRLLRLLLWWTASLALLAGLLVGAYKLHQHRQQRAAEAEPPQVPRRAAGGVVKLGAQLAASHGLADEPARAVSWQERLTVYGRVVPNPRATAEVRAPFAGRLRADPSQDWPAPGARVRAGQVLGWLDIRITPQERLDLLAKLNEARLKHQGAEAVVKVQQARVQRYESASASLARGERDTARVQLLEARTQVAVARAAVQQWQDALDALDRAGGKDATWARALKAPAEGEVTDLAGRPGMAVEAGALVVRVVDFRQVLVRLDLPAALAEGPPRQVELSVAGSATPALAGAGHAPTPGPPPRLVRALLVGAAPHVDAASQLAGYWYEAESASVPGVWRPGLFVKALVPGSDARAAVAVPAGALLYHQGRALVYVRIGPGRYERREVQVLGRAGERWVLGGGVSAGEPVVSRRAQVLLSEEFRGEADND
jgi:hypothetical protein